MMKKNGLLVRDPELSFIFSVNLDGRLDARSIIREWRSKERGDTELKVFKNGRPKPLKDHFKEKERFFSNLLESKDNCEFAVSCNDGCSPFSYCNLLEMPLSNFIDEDFIHKSVLGSWNFDVTKSSKCNSRDKKLISELSSTYIERYYANSDKNKLPSIELITKGKKEIIDFRMLSEHIRFCNDSINIKMYSTGTLSILVKLELADNSTESIISTKDLIQLIQFPNLVIDKKQGRRKGDDTETFPGFLNFVAYHFASESVRCFFSCLECSKRSNIANTGISRIDCLKIQTVCESEEETVILDRYNSNEYTIKTDESFNHLLSVSPYVAVAFDVPNELTLSDSIEKNKDYECFSKLLASIATQTVEFIHKMNDPIEYLKNNSLTRGSRDAIIIEKRGLVACGIRHTEDTHELSREAFLKNPFSTLIFSIETVLATLKSVSAFNKELEEKVSVEINRLLQMPEPAYREVRELRKLVSKARTLSPCEDYSSNLDVHLRSEIAAKGTAKVKSFALNTLIASVQHRLDNYGHFLKSIQEDLLIRKNNRISVAVIRLTMAAVLIAAIQLADALDLFT